MLLLAGCGTFHLPGAPDEPRNLELLAYASSLAQTDAAGRQQALAEAQHRWRLTQNPRELARLGLARGQWGHDGYDPGAAAENLEQALAARSANWSTDERHLLALRSAELAYIAERENALAHARQDHKRLQQALDDARRKLQAITDIERSLGRGPGQ
jgi:hypothetical protein